MNARHEIFKAAQFWTWLEFKLSGWLYCSADPQQRRFWVDGFEPDGITNTRYGADVEGVVWMAEGGRKQWPYRFIASIPQSILYKPAAPASIGEVVIDEQAKRLYVKILRCVGSTELGAAPDGGPAERHSDSGVSGGPSSVS